MYSVIQTDTIKTLLFWMLFSGYLSNTTAQCTVSVPFDTVAADCGDTLSLSAHATAGTTPLVSNFNAGIVGPGWNLSPAGQFDNPCGPGPDGSIYMWMGSTTAAPREMQTAPLDVSCGGQICFDLKFALQGRFSPCEGPDESDEGVYLEWSADSGASWNPIFYFEPNDTGSFHSAYAGSGNYTAWSNYCFPVPEPASTSATIFRWWQDGSSGTGYDHWGIDNVVVYAATCTPYQFIWGTGSYTRDTTVIPERDTTYTVMYTNFSDDTCQASVFIDVTEPTVQVYPADSILCRGDALQFGIHTVGIPANANPEDFQWSPANGLSETHTPTPLAAPSVTTTYTIHYSHPHSGCAASDTATITVESGFDHTLEVTDHNPCLGESVGFDIEILTPGTFTYHWLPAASFDDPTSEDPVINHPIAEGTHTYYAYITSPDGCVKLDSASFDMTNAIPPVINIAASDTVVCEGDSVQLFATETNANPNMMYAWAPGSELSDPTISNPWSHPVANAAMYVVYGVDTTSGCDDRDTLWVNTFDFNYTLEASHPTPCLGDTVGFHLEILTPGTFTYHWLPAAGFDDPTSEDPVMNRPVPEGTSTYYVSITNPNGCVKKDSVKVTGISVVIEASASDTTVCEGDSVQLFVEETNTNPNMMYDWDPGSTLNDSTIHNPWSHPVADTTMYVVYGVDIASGCSDRDTLRVWTAPAPVFNIMGTPDTVFPTLPVDFTYTSANPLYTVFWVMGNPAHVSTDHHPRHIFNDPGTHEVSLYATNEFGCEGTAFTQVVVAADLRIWVPNVFSPNGDGKNDAFFINSLNVAEFHCEIYNRWGKKVYEWGDITQGWDGSSQREGTYYFFLKAVGINHEVLEKRGTLTLLKGR